MISVFFSSGGSEIDDFNAKISPLLIDADTPRQVLHLLERKNANWRSLFLRPDGTLRSDVALLKNIERHSDGRLLDASNTCAVRDLDEHFGLNDTNLLVSLFRPDRIVRFLLETLAGEVPIERQHSDSALQHLTSRVSHARLLSSSRATHDGQVLFACTDPEPIYPFTSGRPVADLVTDGAIRFERNELLPRPLARALANILEATQDLSTFRLRAFQEDVLLHVLSELRVAHTESPRQPLLLSIPTGGGKTEAFLTPLLSHLLDGRAQARQHGRAAFAAVRVMITYPTRALANDQARRLAQIVLEVNAQTSPDSQLSLGVLTGDTPRNAQRLSTETSLLQLCPRCSTVLTQFEQRSYSAMGEAAENLSVARCLCGTEVDFFRFTREEVLSHPPDILVISPDMISRSLQLPRFNSRLFTPHLRAVVLDEIHVYSGAFGCHVAHLLRRVEDTCGAKPLYLGLSATIRNAREVACSLFDAAPEDVRYLRPKARDDAETPEKRPYLDYEAEPTRFRHHYALAPARIEGGRFAKTTTTTINVAHVVGHVLQDPHFRKTLIFSNGRDATDDIVRFGRNHEERIYLPFVRELWPRLQFAVDDVVPNDESNEKRIDNATSFSKVENSIIASVSRWYAQAIQNGSLYAPLLEFGWHRGGLETKERLRAVNRFMATRRLSAARGESPWPLDIIAATSTLELGLDIGDVSVVINCGAPLTVNEYTQRIGRGGRRKDALALTVVDPSNPLDRRFLRRFARYAQPRTDNFEAVPLVVGNRDVCRAHVLARLFDRVAQAAENSANWRNPSDTNELCVGDLRRFTTSLDGRDVRLGDDPHAFSDALWDELFPPEVVESRVVWLRREATLIPGARASMLNDHEWRSWWLAKCRSLHEMLRRPEITDAQPLTGPNALDPELVPDLRGVGTTVGLYWRKLGGDPVPQDTIALRAAISTRPPGGRASQGSLNFRIKRADPNPEVQIEFARILRAPGVERATTYFHRVFGGSSGSSAESNEDTKVCDAKHLAAFPSDPRDVRLDVSFVTPRDLEIEISPSRFYCTQCGATYSHKKADDRTCSSCGVELHQVSEVYACGGCGDTYMPPVPKVCLNPECVARARSRRTGDAFLNGSYRHVNQRSWHNDFFRFSALPRLHWQCRACQMVINFHAHYELPPAVRRLMDAPNDGAQLSEAEKVARNFLWKPEAWWGSDYESQGFHTARFSCPKCRDKGGYRKISVVNVPTSWSSLHEYILHGVAIADARHEVCGTLSFERVRVLAVARDRFETFYSGTRRKPQIKIARIFPDTNQYLASTYEAHAAFLNFGNQLDEFLSTHLIARTCQSGDDSCICRNPDPLLNDDSETAESLADANEVFTLPGARLQSEGTRPAPHLLAMEHDHAPDPRRKWCDIVAGLTANMHCPGPHQQCQNCNYFEPDRFKRYLIIHTIEHALLAAMPLYTGITRGQIRGVINPNDEDKYDLALLDTVEGGSGCLYLLRENWDAIWSMASELVRDARQDPDMLLLSHGCERFNRDLCPVLTHAFVETLGTVSVSRVQG